MVETKEELRRQIQSYRIKGSIPKAESRLHPVPVSETVPTLRQRKVGLGIKCHWTAKGSIVNTWRFVNGMIRKII